MIKRILILAVVRLLSAALTVGAASVTPSSAADYIFTTPLFPDSIRGEVMGDPLAYFDPRGEDIDWLFEAFMERYALVNVRMWDQWTHTKPSFGEWPLSDTNNFYRWSTAVDANGNTNIVVGYNLVTNAPRFSLSVQNADLALHDMADTFYEALGYETGEFGYLSRYLDGGAALESSARAAYDNFGAPSFTNVKFSVSWTNSIVTNINYVSMPMTNGTTSVFSNTWTATFYHPATNAVTNVWLASIIDFCHDGDGPFPGLPNAPELRDAVTRPSHDHFTKPMYDALRAAVRLAEEASITNAAPGISNYLHSVYNEIGFTTNTTSITIDTNEYFSARFYISCNQTRKYQWNQETQQYEVLYDLLVSESRTPNYQAVAPTRFSSEIVTTGNTERVEIEAAFAVVDFFYSLYHQEGGRTNLHWVADAIVDKIVVVPVAFNNHLDISESDARAVVTLDSRSLCEDAASAAGVPAPPEASGYTPSQGTDSYWSVDCNSVVIIYRTKPSSMFNSW